MWRHPRCNRLEYHFELSLGSETHSLSFPSVSPVLWRHLTQFHVFMRCAHPILWLESSMVDRLYEQRGMSIDVVTASRTLSCYRPPISSLSAKKAQSYACYHAIVEPNVEVGLPCPTLGRGIHKSHQTCDCRTLEIHRFVFWTSHLKSSGPN